MRKFFKTVSASVSKFLSPVVKIVRRAFSAIAKVLRNVSIALSGATPSFVYLAFTAAAIFGGMPIIAVLFATATALAMWGTIFHRDQVEQDKLRTGLYILRIFAMLIDVFSAASSVRDSRRGRVQDQLHIDYAN